MKEIHSEPSDVPPLDVLFEAIADRRRRYVLHRLRERRIPMTLADLAADAAAHERGESDADAPDEAVRRVHLSLYHADVPKLADANLVEYTEERNAVALSADGRHVEPFLEPVTAEG